MQEQKKEKEKEIAGGGGGWGARGMEKLPVHFFIHEILNAEGKDHKEKIPLPA